jgi:hypothetical protein
MMLDSKARKMAGSAAVGGIGETAAGAAKEPKWLLERKR